jgi:anti-anti-sigma factor
MSTLKITTREKRSMHFEVALDGRLDGETYGQLQAIIDMLFSSKVLAIQFDLAKLDYISSLGLRVIFSTAKKVKAQGASLSVCNLQPQIKTVFKIANALPSQSIFASIEEADKYFDAMQKQTLAGD